MMNEQVFQELRKLNFRQLIDSCAYIKRISNSLFNEAEILLHKQLNVQLLLITRIYNRKEQIIKLQEETKLRLSIVSEKMLRMITYNVKEVNELCGNFYRVQWIYEFSGHTLYDSIQYRKKKNLCFTDNELLNILESILAGFSIFKSFSIRHGYFQPKHIIQNHKTLQLLISDIRFMTQMFEFQVYYNNQQQNEECYLSPELLKELQKGVQENSTNNEKNEIFSIGLILLECMLLKYPDVYDLHRFAINNKQLQNYLTLTEQKYSIAALVREMLLIDIYHRPSLEQVISLLAQQRYKIQLKSPVSIKSNYILQIDQSKENLDQISYESQPAFNKTISEITPTRKIDRKIIYKKQQELTPITHLSRSPVSIIKADVGDISVITDHSYFQYDNSNLNKTIDLSMNQNPYNFTYRQTTPDRKTKPCPSPFKQQNYLNSILDSQREKKVDSSSQMSIRSQNQNFISYDFVVGIKLDAPNSLKQEFSQLENNKYSKL